MPLSGYGGRSREDDGERLAAIDRCRREVAGPLKRLRDGLKAAETSGGHVSGALQLSGGDRFCERAWRSAATPSAPPADSQLAV
jgi:hypothetical protein